MTPAQTPVVHLHSVTKQFRSAAVSKRSLLSIYARSLGINLDQRLGNDKKTFTALSDINLSINHGERVSLIGRNGAGKSTLLRVVNGSLVPTVGSVKTSGEITSLINIGVGFSQDATGRENATRSLRFSGAYKASELGQLVSQIKQWTELDDFFELPVKTYSLGMLGRLQFACATQVNPSILVIDEVLGAGDAYFVSKCSRRVEDIVSKGSCLILVSHSMQQCLELTERSIWLDQGKIVLDDSSSTVIKEYEQFIACKKRTPSITAHDYLNPRSFIPSTSATTEPSPISNQNSPEIVAQEVSADASYNSASFNLVDPKPDPEVSFSLNEGEFDFVHPTGLSRWEDSTDLNLVAYSSFQCSQKTNEWTSLHDGDLALKLKNSTSLNQEVIVGIVLQSYDRDNLVRIWSPPQLIPAKGTKDVLVTIKSGYLLNAELTVGVSIHESCELTNINTSRRFDLYSESFILKVASPASRRVYDSKISLPHAWHSGEHK